MGNEAGKEGQDPEALSELERQVRAQMQPGEGNAVKAQDAPIRADSGIDLTGIGTAEADIVLPGMQRNESALTEDTDSDSEHDRADPQALKVQLEQMQGQLKVQRTQTQRMNAIELLQQQEARKNQETVVLELNPSFTGDQHGQSARLRLPRVSVSTAHPIHQQMAKLHRENIRLKQDLDESRIREKALKKKLKTFASRSQGLDAIVDQLTKANKQKSKLQKVISKLKGTIAAMEGHMKVIESELNAYRKQGQHHGKQRRSYMERIAELEGTIMSMEDGNDSGGGMVTIAEEKHGDFDPSGMDFTFSGGDDEYDFGMGPSILDGMPDLNDLDSPATPKELKILDEDTVNPMDQLLDSMKQAREEVKLDVELPGPETWSRYECKNPMGVQYRRTRDFDDIDHDHDGEIQKGTVLKMLDLGDGWLFTETGGGLFLPYYVDGDAWFDCLDGASASSTGGIPGRQLTFNKGKDDKTQYSLDTLAYISDEMLRDFLLHKTQPMPKTLTMKELDAKIMASNKKHAKNAYSIHIDADMPNLEFPPFDLEGQGSRRSSSDDDAVPRLRLGDLKRSQSNNTRSSRKSKKRKKKKKRRSGIESSTAGSVGDLFGGLEANSPSADGTLSARSGYSTPPAMSPSTDAFDDKLPGPQTPVASRAPRARTPALSPKGARRASADDGLGDLALPPSTTAAQDPEELPAIDDAFRVSDASSIGGSIASRTPKAASRNGARGTPGAMHTLRVGMRVVNETGERGVILSLLDTKNRAKVEFDDGSMTILNQGKLAPAPLPTLQEHETETSNFDERVPDLDDLPDDELFPELEQPHSDTEDRGPSGGPMTEQQKLETGDPSLVGTSIRIKNLSGKGKNFNGMQATLEEFLTSKDRWRVRVAGKAIAVRSDKIEFLNKQGWETEDARESRAPTHRKAQVSDATSVSSRLSMMTPPTSTPPLPSSNERGGTARAYTNRTAPPRLGGSRMGSERENRWPCNKCGNENNPLVRICRKCKTKRPQKKGAFVKQSGAGALGS